MGMWPLLCIFDSCLIYQTRWPRVSQFLSCRALRPGCDCRRIVKVAGGQPGKTLDGIVYSCLQSVLDTLGAVHTGSFPTV